MIERNLCHDKWLPSCLILVKQFTPAVLAYIVEMKRHWDKPYSHRVPVKGFVWLDIQIWGTETSPYQPAHIHITVQREPPRLLQILPPPPHHPANVMLQSKWLKLRENRPMPRLKPITSLPIPWVRKRGRLHMAEIGSPQGDREQYQGFIAPSLSEFSVSSHCDQPLSV